MNSVRILKEIEKNGEGCNLTLQTLDGIMCHNGEIVKSKYTPVNKTKESFLEEYENCTKKIDNVSRLRPMTLEGCVVRISDIIGYIGKDIEDAKRLKMIDISDIPKSIKEVLGTTNNEIMNSIILDIIEQSYNQSYIQMSDRVYEQVVLLKKFNYENIYKYSTTKEMVKMHRDIFYTLFDVYMEAIEKNKTSNDIYKVFLNNMSKRYLESTSNPQMIIDYFSSMTDNFVESQYKKYIRSET
ncbi:MAG: hypothetical protein RSE00_05395 [Clostridia bacterium]